MFIRFDDRRRRFMVDDSKIAVSSQLSTRRLLRCLEEVRHFSRGRLLDVGCGEKPYRELFQSSHHIGMDWGKSPHSSDSVDVLGDAAFPPFKDEVFDTVLCTEVLEHLSTPSNATKALACVLKPGGHLILSVPFLHWIHEDPFDYFRYTEFGLRRLLEECGLEILTIAHRGGAATVLVDVYARAMNIYTRRIFGALHTPHIMTRVIDYWLIGLPQRLAVRASFLLHQRMPGLATRLDTSRQMTLGYVVVARKHSHVATGATLASGKAHLHPRSDRPSDSLPPSTYRDSTVPVDRRKKIIGTSYRPARLVSVCRLHWAKGHEYVMSLVRLLIDSGLSASLRIVAKGDFLDVASFCRQRVETPSRLEDQIRAFETLYDEISHKAPKYEASASSEATS